MNNETIDNLIAELETAYAKTEEDRAKTFKEFVAADDGSIMEKYFGLRLKELKETKRSITCAIEALMNLRPYNAF